MSFFDDVLGAVCAAIKRLAEESWGEYKSAAIKDGEAFVMKTKADLEHWTTLLAGGELTKDEFEFLLGAKRDLATLVALKQEGLAAAHLMKFQSALLAAIVGAVIQTVGIVPAPLSKGALRGDSPPPAASVPRMTGAPDKLEGAALGEEPPEAPEPRRVLYSVGGWLSRLPGMTKKKAPAEQEGTRIYPVWYGTNRKPATDGDSDRWYSGERDEEVHYGTCKVAIPKSHKIGSLGSGWLKRFLTGEDDRMTVTEHLAMAEVKYWANIASVLADYPPSERAALVYIHGYNTTFEQAALRTAQIGFDLKVPGITAFYSWPSKGTLPGYAADAATIDASESYIIEFLTRFTEIAEVERVHIIAHSMGNRGLLRAAHEIAERASGVPFGQIFLAAPDVDTGTFKALAQAYRKVAERTTLYASSKDKALEVSGTLHDYPRAGHTPPVTIVSGIDTVDVTDVDLSLLGHGYFAEQRSVLQDMHDLIMHDDSPDRRLGLTPVVDVVGEYWRIGK
jgi:esterase/lipase superfamily enzyme